MDQKQKFATAKVYTQLHVRDGKVYDGMMIARSYNKGAKPAELIDWHEFSAALVYLHNKKEVKLVGHTADGFCQYQIADDLLETSKIIHQEK